MSIQDIRGTTGVTRIAALVTNAAATGTPASTPSPTRSALPAGIGPPVDPFAAQPPPLRFPWLSRLSQQLESASRQRSAFQPAPVLGDHLDRSA